MIRKLVAPLVAALAIGTVLAAPASAAVDQHYGTVCKTYVYLSWSEDVCAFVDRNDVNSEIRGVATFDGDAQARGFDFPFTYLYRNDVKVKINVTEGWYAPGTEFPTPYDGNCSPPSPRTYYTKVQAKLKWPNGHISTNSLSFSSGSTTRVGDEGWNCSAPRPLAQSLDAPRAAGFPWSDSPASASKCTPLASPITCIVINGSGLHVNYFRVDLYAARSPIVDQGDLVQGWARIRNGPNGPVVYQRFVSFAAPHDWISFQFTANKTYANGWTACAQFDDSIPGNEFDTYQPCADIHA